MIAQLAERLLCTQRTRVQIPALAPYEITLKVQPILMVSGYVFTILSVENRHLEYQRLKG